MFEFGVADGVLQVRADDFRWLTTGQHGGYRTASTAYNLTVPEGFDRTDLATYVDERRERAGFGEPGPAMLTGVNIDHARGARAGPVTVVATAGLSNPAALPMAPGEQPRPGDDGETADWRPGTVNLLVGSTRALTDGGLATLMGTVVEAKTATLLATTGFSGTTSDAAIVGCRPGEDPTPFAGSATDVGAAARACVREAMRASLDACDGETPTSVADADHGVETTREAESFRP